MLAAREAEERGGERRVLDEFYRTLMSGMLVLPVPRPRRPVPDVERLFQPRTLMREG